MDILSTGLLLVAGIIHLIPLTGLFGAGRLAALYGLEIRDPSLRILLQHRAVLFGMVGGILIFAAVQPSWRPVALLVGLISAVSFLLIAQRVGGYNLALRRVVIADIVAIAAMLAVLIISQVRP